MALTRGYFFIFTQRHGLYITLAATTQDDRTNRRWRSGPAANKVFMPLCYRSNVYYF